MHAKFTFFESTVSSSSSPTWTVSKKHEAKISPRLPLIVWGDKHKSPLNYMSLSSLLPYLKERGYHTVGVEYDNQVNLETLISKAKESLQNAREYKQVIDQNKLSFFLPDMQAKIISGAEMISALEKRLSFFEEVKKLGWTYQGLDMNLGTKRSYLTGDHTDIVYQGQLYQERNTSIASYTTQLYQNSNGGVVTLVGLRHFIEISELLYQSLADNSSKNILFLYVCAPDDPDIKDIIKQQNELTEKYSQQGISFKCELIFSDDNCLKNIKGFIEANVETIAIKRVDDFDKSKKVEIQKQQEIKEVIKEIEEIQKLRM